MTKGIWILQPHPQDIRLLPDKWVFNLKLDVNSFMTEYRAHWVVCGNYQKQGIDYEQSYTPVVCEAAVKLIMTAITMHGLY